MNIGIIVYSFTGNTLFVANRLKEALSDKNTVNIERINSENDKEAVLSRIVLKQKPDLTKYDVLIFASPVNAFTLAPVMKVYLSQITNIYKKKVYMFVTMALPFDWMGGNSALKSMKKYLEKQEVSFKEVAIIHWNKKFREEQISNLVIKINNDINSND